MPSFVLDAERVPPLFHEVTETIGIDLGVKYECYAVRRYNLRSAQAIKKSENQAVASNSYGCLQKAIAATAKLQWRNRNKQLGNKKEGIRASNNAKKFYGDGAKLHASVANQRRDYLQKTTTEISRKYAHIKIEDLNVNGESSPEGGFPAVGNWRTRRA